MDFVKQRELDVLARPLVEWLNKNWHPHCTLVIKPDGYEFSEGVIGVQIPDYFVD